MARKNATAGSSMQAGHPPPLDFNPTPQHVSYEQSSPRTPPSPIQRVSKGKHVSKVPGHRLPLHQTPGDGQTVVDDGSRGKSGHRRVTNDSHDLSWSPRHVTRDSVVDNMLLSLDQLYVGDSPPRGSHAAQRRLFSTLNEEDPGVTAPRSVTPEGGQNRARTLAGSDSLDYDQHTEDTFSRFSRGHRSNSSSNFQSTLRRINSGLEEDEMVRSTRGKIFEAQRAVESGEPLGTSGPSRRRKGSKSSGSSSIDFGQMVGGPRWQRAIERRSSSFDHGYTNRGTYTPTVATAGHPPLGPNRSQQLHFGNYESAPTPTIPAGPRRNRSQSPGVGLPPRTSHAHPPAITLRHKNSVKSSKGGYNKRDRLDNFGVATLRRTNDEYSDAVPDRREVPAFTTPINTASQHLEMPQHKYPVGTMPEPVFSVKERPGFFRRVFGSSRQSATTVHDVRPAQLMPLNVPPSRGSIRPESRFGQASVDSTSGMLTKAMPGGETDASAAHVPLNKKMSFFRRRKKSVTDNMPFPVPPLHLPPEQFQPSGVQHAESSPVSSLRKVMNPYLGSPMASQHYRENPVRPNTGVNESDVAFLAGYTARNESSFKPGLYSNKLEREINIVPPSRDRNLALQDSPGESMPSNSKDHPTSEDLLHFGSSGYEGNTVQIDLRNIKPGLDEPETSRKQGSRATSSVMATIQRSENDIPFKVVDPPEDESELSLKTSGPTSPPPILRSRNVAGYNGGGSVMPTKYETKDRIAPSIGTPSEDGGSPGLSSDRLNHVWIESEREPKSTSQIPPLFESRLDSARASASSVSDYLSASSKIPSPVVAEFNHDFPAALTETDFVVDVSEADITEPNENDRMQAKSIYDGEEDIVEAAKSAPWLGESGPERARVRRAYMELHDWQNLNILAALRDLCGRLLLKGETQQVDRILDAFSTRWCDCNPSHGFKATDVVHTICYSILLLNTDLHMAGIEQKMTRTQFIKNTIPTIRRVAADAAPDGFETVRASTLLPQRGQLPWLDPEADSRSPTLPPEIMERRTSLDAQRPIHRLSIRPSDNSGQESSLSQLPTPLDYDTPVDDCGPLVKTPFHGKLSTWEVQVEIVLKDFYNSIRQQRLPLSNSEEFDRMPEPTPSSSSLSAFTGNILRRTPSMLSKAGSDTQTSRGRLLENKIGTGRWTSKGRSRPRLYPTSVIASSRTSLDDQSSVWSPSVSSTWSRHSLGKTQTSMSVDSFASSFPQGDYKQSIGFANALSQAIIREEAAGSSQVDENIRAAPLLEDESLELAGAPWAKEGILKHKPHLESVDKKAKGRNWTESFAVIEKGWMRLFSFNMNARSMRQKMRSQKAPGGVVGGGNWTENAEATGKFLLRQTIASALPPPGYSKARPHVWALSLPTGAVHLFQVGTPEIVKEFVTTANYWSARLSKEPLVGGVSNIEYGWGDSVIDSASLHIENRPPTASNAGPRPSLQSSIRSSLDQGNVRPKLPGDRVVISDWTPPPQSMMASALMEVDQLKALLAYVKNVEEELQKHNELRSAMLVAFSARHTNYSKAMTNWERKSSYLLHEIVKFRTYIDCLQAAQVQKEKIYATRPSVADEEDQVERREEEDSKATRDNREATATTNTEAITT